MPYEAVKDEEIYKDILQNVRQDPDYYTMARIADADNYICLKELSKIRRNMIDWLDIKKDMQVLELNAGCGINSGYLAKKAGHVTSADESEIKCKINFAMNRGNENLEIRHMDVAEITGYSAKKYDAIILLGLVEEYQKNKKKYSSMHEFLSAVKKLLRSGGHLYIATNNKYGLRYWAGYPESFTGQYFYGVEGFADEQEPLGYDKRGLEVILQEAGLNKIRFFYPYPDYLFPIAVYSDDYLPKKGELSRNMYSFESERLVLFDEEKVFDNLISDKRFPEYSNSFFIDAQGA